MVRRPVLRGLYLRKSRLLLESDFSETTAVDRHILINQAITRLVPGDRDDRRSRPALVRVNDEMDSLTRTAQPVISSRGTESGIPPNLLSGTHSVDCKCSDALVSGNAAWRPQVGVEYDVNDPELILATGRL